MPGESERGKDFDKWANYKNPYVEEKPQGQEQHPRIPGKKT